VGARRAAVAHPGATRVAEATAGPGQHPVSIRALNAAKVHADRRGGTRLSGHGGPGTIRKRIASAAATTIRAAVRFAAAPFATVGPERRSRGASGDQRRDGAGCHDETGAHTSVGKVSQGRSGSSANSGVEPPSDPEDLARASAVLCAHGANDQG
jgi:hypothetical protein